jgi:hypothetical protein
VKISQERTLSVGPLGKIIGQIGPDDRDQLIEGLNKIMGGP